VARLADVLVGYSLGLGAGDVVLDLACGDGGLARFLPGLRYLGVDASEAMVEAARRRGVEAVVGDLNDYEPPEPVAATTCFRAIYYAHDRLAFFRRAASYTERKLVFDLNPRQYRLEDVRRDLVEAGLPRLELRPFFAPQTAALPGAAVAVLRALERTGPAARLALRFRFTYVVAAFR
jgi:SAM-dependent methyltransferase